MKKVESTLIAAFLGIACPFSLFVIGWWTSAALFISHLLPIPEAGIAVSAFAGLTVGVVLDIVALRRWVLRFYALDARFMVLTYLFWSVVALAFFMGLPVGVLALGTCAGVYVGRREHHAGSDERVAAQSARRVGLFAAAVTGTESLMMGLLAAYERFTLAWLLSLVGLKRCAGDPSVGGAVILSSCFVLTAMQYWLTRWAALGAFRLGRK